MEKKTNKKSSTKNNSKKSTTKKNVKKVEVKKDEVKVPEEEIIIKKITEKQNKKFKVTRRDIIVALVFLIIGVIFSLLVFKRAPRLKNGEQVAVSIDKYKVSEQAIYNDIRETNGLNSALRLIDLKIVKDYYNGALDEEAKNESTTQADTYINQYVNYGYTEEDFFAYYGFSNKEDFITYLADDYILNKYFEEKVSASVTDEDVNSYYEQYGMGKKKVYIFSEADGTDNLDKIRASLKKGTSVESLAKKYNNGKEVVVNPDLEIDYSSLKSYGETVAEYIKKTKASSYSKIFNDSNLGNVFVYVASAEDTPAFEDIKEELKSLLVESKKSDDGELYYKIFIEEREAKHIKFYDDAYKKQYEDYVKTHTASESK